MKRLSSNFISLFVSDAASRLLGFVAVVYIARICAVQGFGLIHYGMAFLTYALLFANPGLTTIGAREIAKDHTSRMIIEEILGLRIALAIIVFLVCVIGLVVIPAQALTRQIIFLYLLILFPFALLLEFVFQGREEMIYIGCTRTIQYIVYVVLLFLLLKTSTQIVMIPISFLVSYCAATVFLIAVFIHKYRALRFAFSLVRWRYLLAIALPIGLATLFNQCALNLPPLVLGIFHTKTDVGYFSAGYKVITMLLIVERVFHFVFFPRIAQHYRQAPQTLPRTFALVTQSLFIITLPVACAGIILAPSILPFIYGAGFEGATSLFCVLLLYFVLAPVNTMFGYGLVAIHQEQRFFKIITISACINVVLIIVLGILFKGLGASISLLVSEAVGIVLMNRELKRFIHFTFLRHIIKPFIAACGMAAVLAVINQGHMLLLILVGFILYMSILLAIGGVSKPLMREVADGFFKK